MHLGVIAFKEVKLNLWGKKEKVKNKLDGVGKKGRQGASSFNIENRYRKAKKTIWAAVRRRERPLNAIYTRRGILLWLNQSKGTRDQEEPKERKIEINRCCKTGVLHQEKEAVFLSKKTARERRRT